MSGVAGLFNVPTTIEEWLTWSGTHATHHRDIDRRIYEASNGATRVTSQFILDPINFKDIETWQDLHQILHQEMDAILGIQGYDLSSADFGNPEALAGWIALHSNEHYQAAELLGIG